MKTIKRTLSLLIILVEEGGQILYNINVFVFGCWIYLEMQAVIFYFNGFNRNQFN